MAAGNKNFVLTLCLSAYALPCPAQTPADTKAEVFWETRQRQNAGAAAQLILARDPLTVVVLREAGFRGKVWNEPDFIAATAPPLSSEWLEKIRDGTPMPDFRGKAEDERRPDQVAIYKIWMEAIANAFNTPPDAFAKSAEENSHVTFAHLYNNPSMYRGKVIPITGRLARLRKYEASWATKAGINYVYEGWIFGPTRGSNPFQVIFPILPEGLKEAETMDVQVSFNGYFLKKLKYQAADRSKNPTYLETPLFIGPTLTLLRKPQEAADTASLPLAALAGLVALIVAVTIGLVLISWYFRRGDQALQKRLTLMQTSLDFPFADQPGAEDADKKSGTA
jgi:hypothetical protein